MHRQFQFPSNGKLHSNYLLAQKPKRKEKVSIPFKRETAFKPQKYGQPTPKLPPSFNSLQTGNCIQTIQGEGSYYTGPQSFNSLQTGNCIQTKFAQMDLGERGKRFNSLQTGNCIQTGGIIYEHEFVPCFNSLQTGNCIQTRTDCRDQAGRSIVSIPFKRETAFKRVYPEEVTLFPISFNSLQTGNCIQTENDFPQHLILLGFNSLQTGNCIQTEFISNLALSICCFNSLQTGNCIQTEDIADEHVRNFKSFNSLQTGNCIQTLPILLRIRTRNTTSFNSLQTGNCIQTPPFLRSVGPWLHTPKTKHELRDAFLW